MKGGRHAGEAGELGEAGGFRSIVRQLADELHVKVAFVCEVIGPEREEARTLALSVDGAFLEDMTYKLAGTPCAHVCERGVNYQAKDVVRVYPEDPLLVDWGVDSYMGVAFFDADGQLMGHVGVMNDGPLPEPARVETRLRAVAHEIGPRLEPRSRA